MTYQELQAAYDKLLQENERLKRVAEDAREKLEAAMDGTGLCIWQNHVPTGKLIIFNRRWGAMLGYQPKELSAHFDVWREHLHPEDRERVLQAFFDHLSGKSPFYQVMHRMIAKDGKTTWVLDRGRVVERDAQGNPIRVMGTHIDITHEKEYEQQLAQLAHRDPLTGLLNRTALQRQFPQEYQAICFIDLDDFKQVNDNFGHSHGDALLCQLAERISRSLGPQHFFARLAGDEFVLLLPGHDQAQADAIAEQIRAVMQSPFEVEGVPLTVGISVGISQYQPGWRAEQWLIQADRAMYHDKGAPLAESPG